MIITDIDSGKESISKDKNGRDTKKIVACSIEEATHTSPLVIEILLNFLQTRKKKNIIGFFGDSMQSIYETGVGDIDRYIEQCIVVKVIKEQNRRNPQSVIDIANALRTDGLIQQPSDDISAPNMENGVVKQGTVKFAYSKSFDLKKVKSSILVQGWDFTNAKERFKNSSLYMSQSNTMN